MKAAAAPPAVSRRERWTVVALVAGAFLLRLLYLLEAKASPYFEHPIMDPLYHLEWARALAAGESFQEGEPFFRAPLYPWFLGTVLRLFGPGLFLPRLLQAGLGAATTLLTYLVARRAFDPRAATVAGLLVALNWVLVYFDGELLIPSLAIPLDLAALWVSLRLAREPSARVAGGAGLLWGVAALARPNVLLFLPLLALWLLWRARPRWRAGLVPALALAAGSLAPILPVTTYNLVVGDDAVLISSQAGVNLWIGNNPDSDGATAIVPGTRPGWWEGFHDSIALAEQAEGRELRPSEVSGHYSSKAWAFFRERPGEALGHLAWKARLFWMDWELGNNADVRFFAHRFSRLVSFLPPSWSLLGPLAVLGLWHLRRRRSELFPLWGLTVVYCASVVLFFVCSRYRAPVLPLCAVLAGPVLVDGFDRLRSRRWKPVALGGVLFALLAASTRVYPELLDRSPAKGLWALGIHELDQGRPSEARVLLEESLEANPGYWIAYRDLALALKAEGDLPAAQRSLERGLELVPGDLELSGLLVDVAISRGELAAAEAAARASLERNAAFAPAHDALARVHIAREDWDAARAALRTGLERAPQDFALCFRLGALELEYGDPCVAKDVLLRAMAAPAPANPRLADALQQAWRNADRACSEGE